MQYFMKQKLYFNKFYVSIYFQFLKSPNNGEENKKQQPYIRS